MQPQSSSSYSCQEEEIIIGYDPHSWTQQLIYLVMSVVYCFTGVLLTAQSIQVLVLRKEAKNKIHITLLYICICLLMFSRSVFYMGSKLVLDYGSTLYRFFGFVPPFLQDGSFIVYSLGLIEILAKERSQEGSAGAARFKRIKTFTQCGSVLYAVGYLAVYAVDIILRDDFGKDIYFAYRIVASVFIVGLTLWASSEVRKSLQNYRSLYEQARIRHVAIVLILLFHFTLRAATSGLFVANILIKMKCAGYRDDSNWYYVGYLAVYHFTSEYSACIVIVFMMLFHDRKSPDSQPPEARKIDPTTLAAIEKRSRLSQRMRAKDVDPHGDNLSDGLL